MEDQQALFRLFNPLSPTTRRTTRVLQEIEAHGMTLEELRISQAVQTVPVVREVLRPSLTTPTTNTVAQQPPAPERRRLSGNNFDDSFGQSGSPDEQVIQARGRRQVPLTFSPDVNTTPLRQQMARAKLAAMSQAGGRLMLPQSHTRTSPRKRLRLQDSPPARTGVSPVISSLYSPSPDKLRRSPVSKRLRLSPALTDSQDHSLALRALSHGQLTSLISDILARYPQMRQEVLTSLPTPDLTHHEDNLSFLKKNIFKALPTTRLEAKTDSFAYNRFRHKYNCRTINDNEYFLSRVSVHLLSFKKSLAEGLKTLVESQHWVSTVDYVIMAWSYVR